MNTCTEEFARLTAPIQGLRCDGNPFITFRSPFTLQHWTFPVIELLLIVGAAAGLVHAVRWYRTHRDSSNLVVWISLVSALAIVEPITYFPQWFGLEDTMGLVFAHGQFSIQFLYDRLPLYIVAMYPVYGYLAYVLVQRTGIFRKYNAFVGAVCVAFTFLAFFEIVDMVGPQFRWWVWNREVASANPAIGPVPYASLQTFSLVIPFAVTFIVLLLKRRPRAGWLGVVRNVIIVSLGVWPLMMVGTLLTLAGSLVTSQENARMVFTWLFILGSLAITAYAFAGAYRARRQDPQLIPDGVGRDYFAAVSAVVYLVFCVVFWVAALPDYLAARDGVTPAGDPIASLPFALAAFASAIALLFGAYAGTTAPSAVASSSVPLTPTA